jgi:hypothetical protein
MASLFCMMYLYCIRSIVPSPGQRGAKLLGACTAYGEVLFYSLLISLSRKWDGCINDYAQYSVDHDAILRNLQFYGSSKPNLAYPH